MKNPLIFVAIASMFFGVWPLLAKCSKTSTNNMMLVMTVFSMITLAVFIVIKNRSAHIDMDPTSFWLLVGAGILNGLGLLAYGTLIGWEGQEVSKLIPLTGALMPVFTLIGAAIFFQEPITVKKVVGIIGIGISVYLVNSD